MDALRLLDETPGDVPPGDVAPEDEVQPGCVHHWLLSEPAGGRIVGRCRRCEATRVYPASPESTDRFDDYRELTASSSYHQGKLSA